MRSEWRQWPDPMQMSWPVTGGMAHVVFPMFSGARVQHDDGTWTPSEFTYVEMPLDEKQPYFVVECGYGEDLVPRILTVQVIQQDPSREVRSADLRRLRLEDALEEAWLKVTRRPAVVTDDATHKPAELLDPRELRSQKRKTLRGLRVDNRRKITEDVHNEVARIYRENLASGAPTKAVADHFVIAPSTAFLYVKRARDAGALETREQSLSGQAPAKRRPALKRK
jgi:hypothetical protein